MKKITSLLVCIAVAVFCARESFAGVFDLTHFVLPGSFAVGLEPEVDFTNPAGASGNLKATYGLSDLSNVTAIVGDGSGDLGLRVGANMTFDFFPDTENQPGIGIAAQAIYYRISTTAELETTAIPYIHKSFQLSGSNEVEPFLAVPLGMAFSQGRYQSVVTVAAGTFLKSIDHFRWIAEVGVGLNNVSSYVSGGLVYYP